MSSIKHGSLVAVALAATLASAAAAQARPATRTATQRQAPAADQGFWELGTDMNVGIGLDDPKSLFINIPTGVVRAGYYVSDVLTLEPALRFNSFAQKNATASSLWLLQVGALYHLSANRRANQIFIHPAIGFSGGSGNTRTLTSLSAGAGIKQPIVGGRLVCRAEAGLTHRLKSGPVASATSLTAQLGWSVYTR